MSDRPADGAPSPHEPLSNATRSMMAYWLGEIERGEGPTSGSDREAFFACAKAVWSSLRAVERERANWQALGRSAVEAAQEVIGQCDCIMAETSEKDPKRLWREARDAFRGAARARALSPGAATTESEGTHG